jgi:microsomal dipeptidase-like Zn-dependent dipeptidase
VSTRREFLIRGAALAAAAAARGAGAATHDFSDEDYRRAIVIDGLGGVDDPYSPPEATVLDPRAVADLRAAGLTMSHFTVNAVGNGPDVWAKTIASIAETDQLIADNPDVLLKVGSTADIRRAKREGKSAILYGTQDTSLVGADLDRLVQLTYNLRNLCGEDHVSIGTDGKLSKTVIDDKARAEQKKFYDDRASQGIAAPGEGPEIFNIIVEWDDPMRYRHLAGALSKAGWTAGQIEKALGGNLMRVYGATFG